MTGPAEVGVRPATTVRIESEDRIELSSVGVDIGSATSHLVFSKVTLEKRGTRYVTVGREVLHESDIMLTPYTENDLIDPDTLAEFVAEQYRAAGVKRSDVDSGALILTGVALSRANSRRIAEVFAEDAGKMVAVSAGDSMESVMSAFGSGAVALSETLPGGVLHIDIGGGTTKLALCHAGRVSATLAVDVGARLIVTDADGVIARVEDAGRRIAARIGVDVTPGRVLTAAERTTLTTHMVEEVLGAARLGGRTAGELLRGDPLPEHSITAVTCGGGVAEYVYERQRATFGDLGRPLAESLVERLRGCGVTLHDTGRSGIRATVVGASQYTVQVSGSTIHVSRRGLLPLRNVPIVAPAFDFAELDASSVATELKRSITRFELDRRGGPVGISFAWQGLATYGRLEEFGRGIVDGLTGLPSDTPVVLVSSEDVGRLVGAHITREFVDPPQLVAVDCVDVGDLEFVDVGDVIEGATAVPVVVKTLVFPNSGLPS